MARTCPERSRRGPRPRETWSLCRQVLRGRASAGIRILAYDTSTTRQDGSRRAIDGRSKGKLSRPQARLEFESAISSRYINSNFSLFLKLRESRMSHLIYLQDIAIAIPELAMGYSLGAWCPGPPEPALRLDRIMEAWASPPVPVILRTDSVV